MYCYVDESGHTGANLFDPAQPTLFYELLSASVNLDIGVDRLHATELGVPGLGRIAPLLIGFTADTRSALTSLQFKSQITPSSASSIRYLIRA